MIMKVVKKSLSINRRLAFCLKDVHLNEGLRPKMNISSSKPPCTLKIIEML